MEELGDDVTVRLNPRTEEVENSSKLSSNCGWKNSSLSLADRPWTCPRCGVVHDRDANAARKIELEGLRLLTGSG